MKKGFTALLVSLAGVFILGVVAVGSVSLFNHNKELDGYHNIVISTLGEEQVIDTAFEGSTWKEEMIPDGPVIAGYTFAGWYVDNLFSEPFTFEGTISGDVTLYGKYDPLLYVLTLELNGGMCDITFIEGFYNQPVQLPKTPVRVGYTFGGWYTDVECEYLFDASKMPLDGGTLYAKWISSAIEFRITDLAIEWKYLSDSDDEWRELVSLALITGPKGESIKSVDINDKGELVVTLTDGTTSNLGNVIGPTGPGGADGSDGEDGEDGKDGLDGVGIENVELDINGNLVITLTNGEVFELGKVIGDKGETGPEGKPGREVELQVNGTILEWRYSDEAEWKPLFDIITLKGADGVAGPVGPAGSDGADGRSAYEVAVDNGFKGTEADWLASLVGIKGKSAYEVAVDNGFKGTETEWLDTLVGSRGSDGTPGKSAYELAVDNGYKGSITEWLASLVGHNGKDGADGEDGTDGKDGLSAYELAKLNGYQGTLDEWLKSLVGAPGIAGSDGKDGADGEDGIDGKDGLSAYQIAVNNGFKGSEAQWIASLAGSDGKNAYELSGFSGTIEEWLESLTAYQIQIRVDDVTKEIQWSYVPKSFDNPADDFFKWHTLISLDELVGAPGADGTDGTDGRGIKEMYLNDRGNIEVLYTDGTTEEVEVTVNYYRVTFKDGSYTINYQNIKENDVVVEPSEPQKEGYTFDGWYSGTEKYDFTKPITADLELTAKFIQNTFEVTYVDSFGNVVEKYTVGYGENAPIPLAPAVAGYNFISWDKTANNVKADLTVTAIYLEVNKELYQVVVKDTFGNILAVELVTKGDNITLPNKPEVEGYTAKDYNHNGQNINSDRFQ